MSYIEELASSIAKWLDGKERRTISMLGRLSTVSHSTIRRIVQNEVTPSQENAMLIASVTMLKSEYIDYAARHWPHLKQFVADVSNQNTVTSNELLDFIRSEEHLKVILLASSNEGTDINEVSNLFGENSVGYFQDLIDTNCLSNCDNGKWKLDGDFGSPSFELARTMLSTFTKICNRKNDYIKGISTSWVGWESVNQQTAKEINELASVFCREAHIKMSDPKNSGDILVFSGVLSNVLKGREKIK